MKKSHSILHYLSFGTILAAISLLFYFLFLTLYPYTVVEMKSPVTVQNKNKEVRRGEDLLLRVNYCKYYHVEAVMTNILIADRLIYVLPKQTVPAYVGCRDIVLAVATIPSSLPVEMTSPTSHIPVKLKMVAKYRMNEFRTVEQSWISDSFRIIE